MMSHAAILYFYLKNNEDELFCQDIHQADWMSNFLEIKSLLLILWGQGVFVLLEISCVHQFAFLLCFLAEASFKI